MGLSLHALPLGETRLGEDEAVGVGGELGPAEVDGLAGGVEDGPPEVAGEDDFLALDGGEADGDEGVPVVLVADDAVGAAGHGGVNGVTGEEVAANGVRAFGGDGADGVAGVEVLDRSDAAGLLEVVGYALAEELAD